MHKIKNNSIYCFILYLIFATNTFPQEGWFQQISGTNNPLINLFFVDQNNGWIVGSNGTLLRTTNGGTDWISESTGTNNDLYSIRFIDQNIGWATGENGTILKTTDGGIDWIFQTSGTNAYLTSVFFTDEYNGWVVGEDTVLKTTDGGINWLFQPFLSGGDFHSIYFVNQDTGWIVGRIGIFKTTDSGLNWSFQTGGEDWVFVSVIFIDQDFGWVIGLFPVMPPPPPTKLFSTTNGGTDWTGLPFYQGELKSVYFTDQFNGWVVSDMEAIGNIFQTTDGGINWTNQFSEIMYLNSVFFTNENTGWAVGYDWTTGIILKTINGGVPVDLIFFDGEIIDNEVILRWKTVTETNNRGFEVGRKVIYSDSSFQQWEKIGFVQGSGTTTEPRMYSFTDNNVTSGKYAYRLKQIDFDGSFEYSKEVEVEVSVPLEFSLRQNYPNPFNPNTTIKFSIPKEIPVNLSVYNILGEQVKELKNEVIKPGYYEVEFNATSLASGVYFYRIKAGDFVQTKKMLLLK